MNLYSQMVSSLKWTTITEILAKLITPLSNMILARLLVPEEFGVVTTVTMIISFSDVLTDAGFQKYIIQHDFEDDEQLDDATNVAFWTNLSISLVLWGIICAFNETLATIVGNPGLGHVISIAGISIPITALSSLQMARFKREFRFKQLFVVRFGVLLLPLAVTVPLAILGLSYWALIIGTICGNVFNAVVLTIFSSWRPRLFYSVIVLRKMFSYCIWTLCDSLLVWLTNWADTFIVGSILSTYYLGLYKNSLNTVNGIFTLVSVSIVSVLFVSLSKLQKDRDKMVELFIQTQQLMAMLIIPMGVGLFIYRDFATEILLGGKWTEASLIIGIWSLSSAFRVCFGSINSELYRASGNPKIPMIIQGVDLFILIPSCYLGIELEFWNFVIIRGISRVIIIVPNLIILKKIYNVRIIHSYVKLWPILIATCIMSIVAFSVRNISDSILFDLGGIALCIIVYLSILFVIPLSRYMIKNIISYVKRKEK